MLWRLKNRVLTCDSQHPLIMGIVNVTPDSFSDGGQFLDTAKAVDHALLLESQGADIIDIGGESTRPNAPEVSCQDELWRVIPVIVALRDKIKIPISIDTTKSYVAHEALQAGVEIVNDVSAFEWEPSLLDTVLHHQAGYVLMHAQGNPRTMQTNPSYQNIVEEIHLFLEKKLNSIVSAGHPPESVVIDLGFGFGKTMEHNLTLLKNVRRFSNLNRPILLGVSRKSFLKKIVGPESLESATTFAHIWSSMQGASLWRTHNVLEAVAARKLLGALS